MKKINRIMMVQSMVNTLVDSIKEYETFENKNGYPPMYGNTEQYHTKESIKRRIEAMEDEREKDLLTYRYLKGLKWEEICVRMDYKWRQVHRIHAMAIKNLKMA